MKTRVWTSPDIPSTVLIKNVTKISMMLNLAPHWRCSEHYIYFNPYKDR